MVIEDPELGRSPRRCPCAIPRSPSSRAFEQVAVARIATLIIALVPRDAIPDPEATAWVLHAVVEAANSAAAIAAPRWSAPSAPTAR